MYRERLTARLDILLPPSLRRRLEAEAVRQRRSLSSTVRVLLEEALELTEGIGPLPRQEYEALLVPQQAAHLRELGYELVDLEPEDDDHWRQLGLSLPEVRPL